MISFNPSQNCVVFFCLHNVPFASDLTNDDVITGYIMDQEVDVAMDILRSEIGQHKLRLRAYLLRLV